MPQEAKPAGAQDPAHEPKVLNANPEIGFDLGWVSSKPIFLKVSGSKKGPQFRYPSKRKPELAIA